MQFINFLSFVDVSLPSLILRSPGHLRMKINSFPLPLKSYDWLKPRQDFNKKDPICFLFTFWF